MSARCNRARNRLEDYERLATEMDDFETIIELACEESLEDEVPPELVEEIERITEVVGGTLERLEEQRLFTGEYDPKDAIVSIHPGAGGTKPGLGRDAPPYVSTLGTGRGFEVELNEASGRG